MLVVLAMRNIIAILLKQREYKNLPILAFYAFALLAVSLRTTIMVGRWTQNPIYSNMDWV